jgi:hypothetical protein
VKKIKKIFKVIIKASPDIFKGILIGQIFNPFVLHVFINMFVIVTVAVHK